MGVCFIMPSAKDFLVLCSLLGTCWAGPLEKSGKSLNPFFTFNSFSLAKDNRRPPNRFNQNSFSPSFKPSATKVPVFIPRPTPQLVTRKPITITPPRQNFNQFSNSAHKPVHIPTANFVPQQPRQPSPFVHLPDRPVPGRPVQSFGNVHQHVFFNAPSPSQTGTIQLGTTTSTTSTTPTSTTISTTRSSPPIVTTTSAPTTTTTTPTTTTTFTTTTTAPTTTTTTTTTTTNTTTTTTI